MGVPLWLDLVIVISIYFFGAMLTVKLIRMRTPPRVSNNETGSQARARGGGHNNLFYEKSLTKKKLDNLLNMEGLIGSEGAWQDG
jgi:hypothetical protein